MSSSSSSSSSVQQILKQSASLAATCIGYDGFLISQLAQRAVKIETVRQQTGLASRFLYIVPLAPCLQPCCNKLTTPSTESSSSNTSHHFIARSAWYQHSESMLGLIHAWQLLGHIEAYQRTVRDAAVLGKNIVYATKILSSFISVFE